MRWVKCFLLLGLLELIHFLAFSFLVGWLGKWRLGDVTDTFELIAWIWVGMTNFWAGQAGTWIMVACLAGLGIVAVDQLIRWLALSRRRGEIEGVLREKEKQLRVSLHEEITRQVIAEQSSRKESLDAYKERLNKGFQELARRDKEMEDLQRKVLCWKEELQAIRKKMGETEGQKRRMKRLAALAFNNLEEEPQNISEARRHLMDLVRNKKQKRESQD